MARWEYKHIRLDCKGRGITQEINNLDIDWKRIRDWGSSREVPTLPEMFASLGDDGWEMVILVVNQDNTANGVTFHYYNFKRLKEWQKTSFYNSLMTIHLKGRAPTKPILAET